MDGGEADRWSSVAETWAQSWGEFSAPARRALITAAGITSGTRVLDVGCGSGEFLATLSEVGAAASGIDPAPEMVRLASRHGDARLGDAEELPWPDASFDVVTAINALQFTDPEVALEEFARVLVPGGMVGIANWAEAELNDLDAVEAALAAADGEEPSPGGPLRLPGGLEQVLSENGFEVVTAGVVEVPWIARDDEALVTGILMGEDADVIAAKAALVIEAARPFRTERGGYRLVNSFRCAVATRAASPHRGERPPR